MEKLIDFEGHGLHGFAKGKLMGGESEDSILEFVWRTCGFSGIDHVNEKREMRVPKW